MARRIGFRPWPARVISAIAMVEGQPKDGSPFSDFDSVGDQELANDKWGYSYGGLQVRSLRSHKGTGHYRDEDRLLDPLFNMESGLTIRRDQGFDAWSVYTSGKYKAYLQDIYPPPVGTYIVIGGDTLSRIGLKVGIAWEELARINNLHSPYTLQIGQLILLEDRT